VLPGDHTPIMSQGQRSTAQVSGQPRLPDWAGDGHTGSKTPLKGGSGATSLHICLLARHRYQCSSQSMPLYLFLTRSSLAKPDVICWTIQSRNRSYSASESNRSTTFQPQSDEANLKSPTNAA